MYKKNLKFSDGDGPNLCRVKTKAIKASFKSSYSTCK